MSLPTPLTSFVGREDEVAAVCTLLRRDDVRLVTLVGPGGVGKTRLALRVATDLAGTFADGVRWVELAPEASPERVVDAIAQALGVLETTDLPHFEAIKAVLRAQHLLLVLDNADLFTAGVPFTTFVDAQGAPIP